MKRVIFSLLVAVTLCGD